MFLSYFFQRTVENMLKGSPSPPFSDGHASWVINTLVTGNSHRHLNKPITVRSRDTGSGYSKETVRAACHCPGLMHAAQRRRTTRKAPKVEIYKPGFNFCHLGFATVFGCTELLAGGGSCRTSATEQLERPAQLHRRAGRVCGSLQQCPG